MTPYVSVLNARLRMLLQYRAAAFAGVVTQLFWGLIRMMIFEAFYRSSTRPQPMGYQDVVTYVWLGQAMLALLPWSVDPDVRAMIRTGAVAYELARPVDLYALWYSRAISNRVAPAMLKSGPLFLAALLFFGMRLPESPAAGIAWFVSTLGAILLGSAITTLLTISLMWTVSGEGVQRLVPALTYTLSGMLVPLPLYPDWAQAVLNFLPFRSLVDVPFRLYLGDLPPTYLPTALAHQAAWTVALVLIGRWALSRGTRCLVVQGG